MDRIMCIGELSIATIANKMGITEGNVEFNNEVLLAFKNASFTDKRYSFYQKNSLCRYQWVEFVARLAHKKYIETKQVDTYAAALKRLFGNCSLTEMSTSRSLLKSTTITDGKKISTGAKRWMSSTPSTSNSLSTFTQITPDSELNLVRHPSWLLRSSEI